VQIALKTAWRGAEEVMCSVHEMTFLSSGVDKNKLENEEQGRKRWVIRSCSAVISIERLLQCTGKTREVSVRSWQRISSPYL